MTRAVRRHDTISKGRIAVAIGPAQRHRPLPARPGKQGWQIIDLATDLIGPMIDEEAVTSLIWNDPAVAGFPLPATDQATDEYALRTAAFSLPSFKTDSRLSAKSWAPRMRKQTDRSWEQKIGV